MNFIRKIFPHFFVFYCVFLTVNPSLFSQSTWQPLGPTYNPGLGIGRLERIAFDPGYNGTTNKIMYVGSPTGGLWKSIDGGLSWSNKDCSTDQLPFIGVADIAINPHNPKQLFIANGTRYKRKYISSLGIYKSEDGGKTWMNSSRGLFLDPDSLNCIARLIIDSANIKTLYAATSQGIYKTTTAGKKWKKILSGDYHGLEFNPKNSKIIYAAGTRTKYEKDVVVMRSIDAGKKWNPIADGNLIINAKEIMLIDIAIAPSNPDIIYIMVANKDQLSNNDLYVSTDGGKTWRSKPIPYPNDHRDKASIIVSPTNPGEIYIGKAWDFYKSIDITDTAFPKRAYSKRWKALTINHADIHDFAFAPKTNELFVAEDGGLWNATKNKESGNGLNIATINSIGTSETKTGFVITGEQDCGSNIYDSSLPVAKQWRNVLGGDGREGIIDYTNDKIILSATSNMGTSENYGPNQRSIDGGDSFTAIDHPNDPALNGLNNAPLVEDPLNHNVYYFGYTQLYKASFINETSNEIKWEKLSQIPEIQYSVLTDIAVNQSNPKFIYAGFVYGRIFKTIVGGEGNGCSNNCWTDVSPFKNLKYHNFVKLATQNNEPTHVWAAFTGTNMYVEKTDSATKGENKIMYSPDGGESWQAFGQGLPETPVYTIVYVKNANNLLFIGTEMGVYFRDADMKTWKHTDNGFPNVIVDDLEVNYHEKKLYVATYGRGLWTMDLSRHIID